MNKILKPTRYKQDPQNLWMIEEPISLQLHLNVAPSIMEQRVPLITKNGLLGELLI